MSNTYAKLQFKCRKCGVIEESMQTTIGQAFEALREQCNKTYIHNCPDGSHGICELAGCVEIKN